MAKLFAKKTAKMFMGMTLNSNFVVYDVFVHKYFLQLFTGRKFGEEIKCPWDNSHFMVFHITWPSSASTFAILF